MTARQYTQPTSQDSRARLCPRCGEMKPTDGKKRGYCQDCRRAYSKAWRAAHPGYMKAWEEANPEKIQQYRSESKVKRRLRMEPRECDWCLGVYQPKIRRSRYCSARCSSAGQSKVKLYGLTAAQFHGMLEAQGHRCAICRRKPQSEHGRTGWQVDHDHNTGAIRGLLCGWCNRAIGLARDDPEVLRAMAAYVEASPRLFVVDNAE